MNVFFVFTELALPLSRFTQNLSVFRRDINDSLKGPVTSSSGSSGSEMMTSWRQHFHQNGLHYNPHHNTSHPQHRRRCYSLSTTTTITESAIANTTINVVTDPNSNHCAHMWLTWIWPLVLKKVILTSPSFESYFVIRKFCKEKKK